jgi:hypothetical protein
MEPPNTARCVALEWSAIARVGVSVMATDRRAGPQYLTCSPGPNSNPNVEELLALDGSEPDREHGIQMSRGTRLARFLRPKLRECESRVRAQARQLGKRSESTHIEAARGKSPVRPDFPGQCDELVDIPRVRRIYHLRRTSRCADCKPMAANHSPRTRLQIVWFTKHYEADRHRTQVNS